MAQIHDTTLTPSKLDLLATWLPSQSWYDGPVAPVLSKAGGFRLDDPAGEVGIEFMIVNAAGGGEARTYHVPMTYRGAPLAGAESALIGHAMHGVLGARWIYDGAADPALLAELTRLLRGVTLPQHQARSNEVDRWVQVSPASGTAVAAGARILRVLDPGDMPPGPGVTTTWITLEGAEVSGPVAVPEGREDEVRYGPSVVR